MRAVGDNCYSGLRISTDDERKILPGFMKFMGGEDCGNAKMERQKSNLTRGRWKKNIG